MDLTKVDLMCQVDSMQRGWQACEAERDALRARAEAADATVAGLRAALEYVALYFLGNQHAHGKVMDALAATPDQHAARIRERVLREAAKVLREMHDAYGVTHIHVSRLIERANELDKLADEAAKEAGNGTL